MRPQSIFAGSVLLLAFAFSVAAPAAAQVRDDGQFFSGRTESELTDLIGRVKSKTGKTLVIETLPALPTEARADFQQTASKADFWDRFIQSRGRSARADVMVLVTRDPSHLEVGASTQTRTSGAFTAADHKAVSQAVLGYFKANEYDAGILRGAAMIEDRLTAGPAAGGAASSSPRGSDGTTGGGAAAGGSTGYPGNARQQAPSCGAGGMGSLLCIGIAVIGLFMLFRGIMGRRQQQSQQGGMFGQGPGGPPPIQGGGYGGMGGGGGGGFGRGVGGGLLGGLLGGWVANRVFGQGQQSAHGAPLDNTLNPTDPGPASSGGDFGGGDAYGGVESSGGDFGGGGDSGGGGDASSGGDF